MFKPVALSLSLLLFLPVLGQTGGPRHLPVPSSSMGPSLPHLRGVRRAGARVVYPSLNAAVVMVVEDQPAPWVTVAPKGTWLFRCLAPVPIPDGGLSQSSWMEASRVVSGGNTIAQLYPLGWGY